MTPPPPPPLLIINSSCFLMQNYPLRLGKSIRSAGSTINRTVSFRFFAFVCDAYNVCTSNRPQIFCYKIVILFICYYNGNTRLNYVKPRLTLLIRDLLKSQAISCQLDFNSCFPSHADQYFCNLHPHARTICCTNDTSRNVKGCSNPNAHAQFP